MRKERSSCLSELEFNKTHFAHHFKLHSTTITIIQPCFYKFYVELGYFLSIIGVVEPYSFSNQKPEIDWTQILYPHSRTCILIWVNFNKFKYSYCTLNIENGQ